MSARVAVDGMRLEVPSGIAGLPSPALPGLDWGVEIERDDPDRSLSGVRWTGDVRHAGERWARFGRRGPTHVVQLEGLATLVVDRAAGNAVVTHDCGEEADVAVLRRLSPYLAALSGRLVLHAAGVVLEQGAVLLLGESGAGKSTLALAFDAHGAAVLGDDHVAIDAPEGAGVLAHASFRFADASEPARAALARPAVEEGEGKASVALATPLRRTSEPVVGMAFLRRGARVAHEPLAGPTALARCLQEAVFIADPDDRAALAARLDDTLRLLARAPSVTLTVPDGLERLGAALAAIAAPWGGIPR